MVFWSICCFFTAAGRRANIFPQLRKYSPLPRRFRVARGDLDRGDLKGDLKGDPRGDLRGDLKVGLKGDRKGDRKVDRKGEGHSQPRQCGFNP